ncbi:MAG: hypothetical protein Q9194_003604, partial [Teloschistes cf. exilis]
IIVHSRESVHNAFIPTWPSSWRPRSGIIRRFANAISGRVTQYDGAHSNSVRYCGHGSQTPTYTVIFKHKAMPIITSHKAIILITGPQAATAINKPTRIQLLASARRDLRIVVAKLEAIGAARRDVNVGGDTRGWKMIGFGELANGLNHQSHKGLWRTGSKRGTFVL